MANDLNKALLMGRVGKEPEVKSNGQSKIARFSIATSQKWKTKDGSPGERTDWHNIIIFNDQTAKFAESYVHKGDLVFVEGEIQQRKYLDKSGAERTTTEIVISQFNGSLKLVQSKSSNAEYDELDKTLMENRPKSKPLDLTPQQKASLLSDLDSIPDWVPPSKKTETQKSKPSSSDDIPF